MTSDVDHPYSILRLAVRLLVILKLTVLTLFLKFEIEGSFARRGRRVVCGDQTGLLGQCELLLGRLRDAGRAARALV